jgi:hypothetical protein
LTGEAIERLGGLRELEEAAGVLIEHRRMIRLVE